MFVELIVLFILDLRCDLNAKCGLAEARALNTFEAAAEWRLQHWYGLKVVQVKPTFHTTSNTTIEK